MLTTFSLFTSRLAEPDLEQLGRRLQFKREYLNHLQNARIAIARLPELDQEQPPSRVVCLLEPLDEVGWLVAWAAAPSAAARDQIARFACEWRFVRPTLHGRDVETMTGLKPGPIYGVLLGHLRRAWLDGEVSTQEEEKALLLHLVSDTALLLPLKDKPAPDQPPED